MVVNASPWTVAPSIIIKELLYYNITTHLSPPKLIPQQRHDNNFLSIPLAFISALLDTPVNSPPTNCTKQTRTLSQPDIARY